MKFMKAIHVALICLVFSGECSLLLASEVTKFTADQLKLPGKKGACFQLMPPGSKKGGTVDENIPKINALNVSWNYSWGPNYVKEQPANIEFLPMIWSAKDKEKLQKTLDTIVIPSIKNGEMKRLLGFNEPDQQEQANMTYLQALEYWPLLEKLGIPLCSPACANSEGINDDTTQGVRGTWMRDFMKEADQRGYRVDYIGVHCYGRTNPLSFKEKMRRIYEKYGKRPLLITEFACADWTVAGEIKKNRQTPEKVLQFMKEVLPWMQEQEWIAGYAWFSFRVNSPVGTSSALFDEAGELTACGRYYSSVTPENPNGDQSIQPDPDR